MASFSSACTSTAAKSLAGWTAGGVWSLASDDKGKRAEATRQRTIERGAMERANTFVTRSFIEKDSIRMDGRKW
jgi:hypothetical protein